MGSIPPTTCCRARRASSPSAPTSATSDPEGERTNAQSDVREGDLYLDYRPDLHAYDASSGDPGRIGYAQFRSDPSFSPTPDNHDWVSRYSGTLSYDRDFAGSWRLEGKVWGTYQDLASRSAANSPAPTSTTLQDELFRSEGLDLRLRDRWGRGNAFTVGVEAYHDDAPFRQFNSPDVLADSSDDSGTAVLRQARQSNVVADPDTEQGDVAGRVHVVPSVRVEREEVSVNETVRPPFLSRPLLDVDATRYVPLFGIGIGNDFGRQNETYFSVTQGWRPLRFFDVASPFSNVGPANLADNSKSVSYEGGVHGTPVTGLFYDAGLFWIDFDNRIETIVINATDSVNQNSGDTRNRGFEGEVSYDFLAAHPGGRHLSAFANLQLLDARFTRSDLANQVGRVPAFAPHALGKYGLTYRAEGRYSVSLTGVSVSSQFFQDSDLPGGTLGTPSYLPAKVGGYTVLDLAADWYLTKRLRVLGGVSNFGDVRYYSRVFQNGIEPALGRNVYAGLALGF